MTVGAYREGKHHNFAIARHHHTFNLLSTHLRTHLMLALSIFAIASIGFDTLLIGFDTLLIGVGI